MQWEGPAEVPVDLILFRWINFHLGKVLPCPYIRPLLQRGAACAY